MATGKPLTRKSTAVALSRKFSSAITEGNVSDLVACGFSERIARTALNRKFGDMQSALDECLRLQNEHEPKVQELVSMGFSEAHATHALNKCDDNLEEATNLLLNNAVEVEELMHAQPTTFRHPQARDLSAFFQPQKNSTPKAANSQFEESKTPGSIDADIQSELPPLAHRPVYDRDMVARFEHRQRAANYSDSHLNPSNIALRRAQSHRIHSSHQRSLLDFKAAIKVEEELFGGLPLVESINEDYEEDEEEIDVEQYLSTLGFSSAWNALQELEISADMLKDETSISDQALAENVGISLQQASQFRTAVLNAHGLITKPEAKLSAEVAEELVAINFNVNLDLGFRIDDHLKVIVEPNGQAEKNGILRGWQLINAGGFGISGEDDLLGAIGALKMTDQTQSIPFTFDKCNMVPLPVETIKTKTRRPSAFMQDLTREDKIVQGKERLHERLAAETLKEIEMEDDGNCQFRALSSECYGTQRWHKTIRSQVVEHMSTHSDEFEIYFSDRSAFQAYLSNMRDCGTWGDELTLRAACDLLNVKVYVITSEEENWLLHYDPPCQVSERSLFITYVCPIHYNTIEHDTSAVTSVAPISTAGTHRKVLL